MPQVIHCIPQSGHSLVRECISNVSLESLSKRDKLVICFIIITAQVLRGR